MNKEPWVKRKREPFFMCFSLFSGKFVRKNVKLVFHLQFLCFIFHLLSLLRHVVLVGLSRSFILAFYSLFHQNILYLQSTFTSLFQLDVRDAVSKKLYCTFDIYICIYKILVQ